MSGSEHVGPRPIMQRGGGGAVGAQSKSVGLASSHPRVVGMLVESKWEWTPQVELAVSDLYSTVGATKIIEDGWQKERHREGFHCNRQVWHGRAWMAPVYGDVMNRVHHYDGVPYKSQEVPRGGTLPSSLFVSVEKASSMKELKQIVGTQPGTPWYGPSLLASLAQVAMVSGPFGGMFVSASQGPFSRDVPVALPPDARPIPGGTTCHLPELHLQGDVRVASLCCGRPSPT